MKKIFIFFINLTLFTNFAFATAIDTNVARCFHELVTRTLYQHSLRDATMRRQLPDLEMFFELYKNDDKFAYWVNHFPKEKLRQIDRNDFPVIMLERWLEKKTAIEAKTPALEAKHYVFDFEKDSVQKSSQFKTANILDDYIYRTPFEDFPDYFPYAPSVYDINVANLRKGDTVQFKENGPVFTLGEFLGSGNATHIFDCASCSKPTGIRFPFVAEPFAHPLVYEPRMEFSKKLLRSYVNRYQTFADSGVNIVEIDPSTINEGYLLVEKVNGKINGRDFFEALYEKYNRRSSNFPKPPFVSGHIDEIAALIHPEESKKLMLLKEQMMKIKRIHAASPAHGVDQFFRQFVWDETKLKWILVDWE